MKQKFVRPSTFRYQGFGMAAAFLIASMGLMACSLFSRATTLTLPDTGKMSTAIVSTLESASPGSSPSSDGTTGGANKTGIPSIVITPKGQLPVKFRYADLDFSLQKAAISSQPPEGVDTSAASGLYATTLWQVVNHTTQVISIPDGVFTLKLGDGSTYTAAMQDTAFQSQDTQNLSISFNVPGTAKWDGAQISFAQPGKEPVSLSLDGPAPQPAYPLKLASGQQAQVDVPGLVYQVQEASLDLDAMGQRADQGKRYLLLTINATCRDKYDCYVGPESFRVLVDGEPLSADKLEPPADAVKSDNHSTFHLAFLIPGQGSQVILQVGESGKSTAKIPIDLSGAKP